MGFQTYSSFMSHALGDKSQTSLLSTIDASSEGDLSVCGERGDSPASLSHQGSLESESCAADSSNGHLSPTSESHKNTRQRTAQACDKCRERKTKCSGNRPMCNRCSTRGLICEYSVRESRVRTPIRVRAQLPISSANPLQVNYHDIIRPTPAYHSRMGQGQSQAFAPSSHPRTVSYSPAPSSSGQSSERGVRSEFSYEQPIPLGLGLGLLPGGRAAAAQLKRGMSTWDMRVDTSRPQSAPITPQCATDPGVPSHRFKMEPSNPQVQDMEEGSSVSYGHVHTGRRNHMAMPSVRVQENSPYRRSPLGGGTETAKGSSQWYKTMDNTTLVVPKSLYDGRPSSMPTMPLVQPNTQLSQKEFEPYYDTSLYRPNLFEEWTGPSSMGPDQPLPEATSILAAHYNSLECMSSNNATLSAHPRTATNTMPGPYSQQDSDPLEVLCPAPLLPIESGMFGLPSSMPLPHSTGRPTASSYRYDAVYSHAAQQQQQQDPDFDAMYMRFSHGASDGHGHADVGGFAMNTHHQNPSIPQPHPHAPGRQPQPQHPGDAALMSMTGHPGDFHEYDFF